MKCKIIVFATMSLCCASPNASAQDLPALERRLAECSEEQEAGKRLECFDALATDVPKAKPLAESPIAGTGSAGSSSTTPLSAEDGSASAGQSQDRSPPKEPEPTKAEMVNDAEGKLLVSGQWVILRSIDSMTDRPRIMMVNEGEMELGRSASGRPTVILRCFQSRLEVYVNMKVYIGTRDTFATKVRFGTAEPVSQRWQSSTDGQAVFASDSVGFLNRLSKVEKLLLEVTTFSGDRYRATFATKGLEGALPEISSCWRPPQAQPTQKSQTQGQQRPASQGR